MKILVVHASAGAGHMKAAEAIAQALKKRPDCEVVLLDGLDQTSPAFKKLYRDTYAILITKFPAVWGFVFAGLDLPFLQPFIRFFRRVYNKINFAKLEAFIKNEKFDYVVATHFMPTEIVSAMKLKKSITSKLITVVTDYDVHRIWLGKAVDHYCVASPWTREKILTLGVAENMVHITGIPTDERFSQIYDIGVIKKKLEVKEDVFTVLMATGSFGIGPIEETIKALKNFQVIVVCGHNKNLYERLSKQAYPSVKVCGLVDNMYELMAASDVMVTKPGGLSISEAMVTQLPLVFFNPIPGQETNNIKVLATYGVGFHAHSTDEIVKEVSRLASYRDFHHTALKKTKQLSYPNAASDITRLII